jgi:short-subunit dehydrogenase
MNKYAKIIKEEGSDFISLNNVASCYINDVDEIIVAYENGSTINIASASFLIPQDLSTVFDVIKSAQEDKWSKVLYEVPPLTQPVDAVTFTF